MKILIGKKIEMSQVFDEEGDIVPITRVFALPQKLVRIKTEKKDGYASYVIGAGLKKRGKASHLVHGNDKEKKEYYEILKEFRSVRVSEGETKEENQNVRKDSILSLSQFTKGEKVKVCGCTKGKGFQGVVKRHGFSGMPTSHGHKDQMRHSGSVGCAFPEEVFRGKRMPGRMGFENRTIEGVEIISTNPDKNILELKGSLPGARGSLVFITSI